MLTQNIIQLKQENGIATLTLNAPEVRNAFDDKIIAALTEQLQILKQDAQCRVLVLGGKGEHFSAGANIQWMQRMANASKEENYQDALKLSELLSYLNHFNKPTIALVQGSIYGGAIGLVACCDIVLAAPNSHFCFSEVKLGLVPAIVCPYVLNAIGSRAARRYMLTAEPFGAEMALKLGLVHEVLPQEQWEQRLHVLTSAIEKNAPNATRIAKELIHTLTEQRQPSPQSPPILSQVEYTARLIADLRVSQEGQEGLLAFLEKRQARWINQVTNS